LGIEVIPATRDQEPVLANLLELYAHDFSELIGLQLQSDGRFGYPSLPLYWQEERRYPFLVTVEGRLAGFVLVAGGSRTSGDPDVWDMAEFFIVRGYRRRGIGAAVAQEVWARFPGSWEVRVRDINKPAHAFWRTAISQFTGSDAPEADFQQGEKRWWVFSFNAPSAVA
jgi:predicted acetyltransferase